MARASLFLPGTAAACIAAADLAHAAWGKQAAAEPPSPVDAADPAPATPPKADSILYPEVVGPAGGRGPVTLPPYEGTEYKLGPFRLRPAQMHMEGIMVAVLAAYLVTAFLSRKANRSRAAKWFKANERVYREEFSGVGLGGDKLFEGDGGDEFVSYATGRRGVESAWSKVSTGGYDLLAKLYDAARGIADYAYDSGADRITVDLKLAAPKGTPGAKFVFAVVRREVLKKTRDARWDLRKFTTTSETAGVSPSLIVMTESGDVTSAMLKDPDTGLFDALKDGSEGLEYLESLVISDMPLETPDEEKPKLPENEFRLTLSMRLPPASKSAATAPWIQLACNIADVIYTKQRLLPEGTVNKLKKRRAEVLYELRKAEREEEAARAQEAKDDAAALKRKVEQSRVEQLLAKMTPAERVKYQKKEEEKERKKAMQKQAKRMR
ncbi:CCDC47 family protein [Rhodotorula paludigena]|uniref:CCDC47 family protein n=1 Tax=Rhodotorula paludigena TaxID=86838 RepID=UPI003176A040